MLKIINFIQVRACNGLGLTLEFVNTSAYSDSGCVISSGVGLKPDVCVYAKKSDRQRHTDFSKMEISIEFKRESIQDAFVDPPSASNRNRHIIYPNKMLRPDFSRMETLVEVKFTNTSDPCHDPEDPLHLQANDFRFENDSDDARLVRGQLASYAAAHMGCQFRVHAFTVLICGKFARLIRWDRDGATVTRPFDYNQLQTLADFFWRYTHLDRRQRGYDTSVSSASPGDIQRIQRVENRLRDNNPAHREFCKVLVPDRSDPEVEKPFIISSPPTYTARSHQKDEPPEQCWHLIWKQKRSFFLRTIGDWMWMVCRRKAKSMPSWNLRACQILHLLERIMICTITWPLHRHWETRSGLAGREKWSSSDNTECHWM